MVTRDRYHAYIFDRAEAFRADDWAPHLLSVVLGRTRHALLVGPSSNCVNQRQRQWEATDARAADRDWDHKILALRARLDHCAECYRVSGDLWPMRLDRLAPYSDGDYAASLTCPCCGQERVCLASSLPPLGGH